MQNNIYKYILKINFGKIKQHCLKKHTTVKGFVPDDLSPIGLACGIKKKI